MVETIDSIKGLKVWWPWFMISYLDDTMFSLWYYQPVPLNKACTRYEVNQSHAFLNKMEIVQICSNWQYLCVNVLIGIELLKPSRTHVCQYLLLLDVRYKLKYNSLSIFLKSRIQRGAVKCQGGAPAPSPAPPSPQLRPRVNKEVIKYLVSVTAPQLLTWLIFDTFVKFYKYYKISVSK